MLAWTPMQLFSMVRDMVGPQYGLAPSIFTISAGYDPNYSHRTISPGLLANLIKKIVKNHFVNLPGLG